MVKDAAERFGNYPTTQAHQATTPRVKRWRPLLMAAGAVVVSNTQAAAEPLQQRPRPPQVAIDACRSQAEGDACSVEFRGQKISGTCRKAPGGEESLICMPEGPPPELPE
jgi:hypothetical protein